MEEKRYPNIDEEENSCKVSEPSSAPALDYQHASDGITKVHDWIDDIDWDRIPNIGPFSDEEAIARIEAAEKDLNDPTKWVTSEEMTNHLYEKYPWLR